MMSRFRDAWLKIKRAPLIPFILLRALIFLVFFFLARQFYFDPGALELDFARHILEGKLPYRDFASEYPPLALISFLLPALICPTNPAYIIAFALEMLVFDLATLGLIASLAPRLKFSVEYLLGVYTVLIIAVGPIVILRYDLLPATLTLAALTSFIDGGNLTAWLLTAFGASAKLYPVIIAPLMALNLFHRREIGKLIKGGIAFILTFLIINLPFYLLSPENFLDIFTYHAKRGLHAESSYASVLLIGRILGLNRVTGRFNFGSWNLASPLADRLADLSFYISASLLLTVYAIYFWKLGRKPEPPKEKPEMTPAGTELFLRYGTLAVAIFLTTGKVLSPQYLIWLLPLLPVARGRCHTAQWLIFAAAGFTTQFIFPYNYINFETFNPPYVLVMAIRNALLIVLAVMLALPRSRMRHN